MRPLRYSINVTLDGCIDHLAIMPDEELHQRAAESIAKCDALIFGRVTYQMMEEAWRPAAAGIKAEWMDDWMLPFANIIDKAKKYVVSRTLPKVDWNAELLQGDLAEGVRRLKAMPGKGIATGGVMLPKALAELGLIDEYEFVVHPRVAGRGPSLFAGMPQHLDLKLVDRLEYGSGAVALRYQPQR
jgi:dihydrofolate reductase